MKTKFFQIVTLEKRKNAHRTGQRAFQKIIFGKNEQGGLSQIMLTNSCNGHWSTIHVAPIFPPFCVHVRKFILRSHADFCPPKRVTKNKKKRGQERRQFKNKNNMTHKKNNAERQKTFRCI
jgi:hypothetical protein